jgi:hemolysin III
LTTAYIVELQCISTTSSSSVTGIQTRRLIVAGGVLYNIGAILYGLRWPNPWPESFGHHEFFHAFTAAAATCHYIAVWLLIV